MKNYKFSIVIPTYNSKLTISKCIESVINQNYINWEVIIVDNFSNDGTLEVIKSYNNNKIRVFKIKNDGIISKSRNYAIKKSEGEIISFLDSDDYWAGDKLYEVNLFFNKNINVDFLSHDLETFGKRKVKLKNLIRSCNNQFNTLYFNTNVISPSSTSVKKIIFDKVSYFPENKKFATSEDYWLWLKFLKFGIRHYNLPKVLSFYFLNDNSSSKNFYIHFKSEYNVLNDFYRKDINFFRRIAYRNRIGIVFYNYARNIYKYQSHYSVVKILKLHLKCLKLAPFFFRNYFFIIIFIFEYVFKKYYK